MKDEKKGFNMSPNIAYNIYAQNSVNIESPVKLIEMLYEGMLRFNAQAKKAIKDKNIEKKIYWINRSIAVITELLSSLDLKQGDVALYLDGLYNYQIQLITEAGFKNNIEKIDESSRVFKELLTAWRETTSVD